MVKCVVLAKRKPEAGYNIITKINIQYKKDKTMTKNEIKTMTEEESQLAQYLEEMDKLGDVADDREGYIYEAPVHPFVRIRQKDLKNKDTGEVLVKSGAFTFGSMVNPPTEVKVLEGVVVSLTKVRTYFKSIDDAAPTCQSRDGNSGSEERKTENINGSNEEVYGDCRTCVLRSSFIPGFQCKEGRSFAFLEKTYGPIILGFGQSGINPWRMFHTYLQSLKKETLPLHIFKIKVSLEFRTKPAEFYRPQFELAGIINKKELEEVKKIRTKMFEEF